jgi:hypothetical protein
MNGYRSHLRCRPVIWNDAKENQSTWQEEALLFDLVLLIFYMAIAGLMQIENQYEET